MTYPDGPETTTEPAGGPTAQEQGDEAARQAAEARERIERRGGDPDAVVREKGPVVHPSDS